MKIYTVCTYIQTIHIDRMTYIVKPLIVDTSNKMATGGDQKKCSDVAEIEMYINSGSWSLPSAAT